MVATGENEVSDKPLVPVDDEVTTKLLRLFVSPDKLRRRMTTQITSDRLRWVREPIDIDRSRRPYSHHDRDEATITHNTLIGM